MKKDFLKWHKCKQVIQNEHPRLFFHEQDIWFCHLGENVGVEQDGRGDEYMRPVIVLKKFNNEVFWAVPLTMTQKKNKYYFAFKFKEGEVSTAILSQLRLIDAKRLRYKMGVISKGDSDGLKGKIRQLLA
ncbi:MAG TPA: type II toxin-antitoxin system PemK/MazF family toxin [Candidatus Paceibacterota bacterium]